jgi:hypothetical protein
MPTLRLNQFYCVCCGNPGKGKVVTLKPIDIKFVRLLNKKRKNGVAALKGLCRDCGCNLHRFIKESQVDTALSKYGR